MTIHEINNEQLLNMYARAVETLTLDEDGNLPTAYLMIKDEVLRRMEGEQHGTNQRR